MTALVNTFLNVSRIQLGKLKISPELDDVRVIIDDVVKRKKILANNKKIKIEKFFDNNVPLVKIDHNIFNIIMENFIDNAIKYSPEKETVAVSCGVREKDLFIEVTNAGVGIPKTAHHKIFSQMFRADNTEKIEGSGLGLYLVRSIVDQSGGKVWFDSPSPHLFEKNNRGSTFYFSLPLSGMKTKK